MSLQEKSLLEQLKSYSHSDYYPFHMPGHKRQLKDFPNPWSVDLTEIEGFDNLHHPEGVLAKLQRDLAALFQTGQSYVLINGSTCGLMAAISACVPSGGKLLMSRNCHKSVYHCLSLRNIHPVYLMPQPMEFGILGSLSPEKVQEALDQEPNVRAVLVVSPTYDGVLSDIATISEIAHSHGVPLVVDEAHGAHLALASSGFPPSALTQGADLVIQSLHKTLPTFTQSAIIHRNSNRVSKERLERFLQIYQSSSPSYLLMASVDYCQKLIKSQGKKRFTDLRKHLDSFYRDCQRLNHIHILTREKALKECYEFDDSKILFMADGFSGENLSHRLREQYHLQMEMDTGHYVLALCSLMDTEEGFSRLSAALQELDATLPVPDISISEKPSDMIYNKDLYKIPARLLSIEEALDAPYKLLPLSEAVGQISGSYLFLYPPGIPLAAPGELLDESMVKNLSKIQDSGVNVQGLVDNRIKVALQDSKRYIIL